uniref:G protein-coupled receptor n=1 Tax=Panagrolaimus sp. ES5 TaxID=591445 RepID=A0AC34F489_9BILA
MYNWYHFITRIRTDRDFEQLLNGTDWVIDGKIPPFGAYSLLQDGPNEKIPISSTHMQYLKIVYMLILYAMIIVFAIRIFLTVRKSEGQMAHGSNKYQRQITIVMTIEAIVPLFTLIIPILLDLLNFVTGIRISWTGVIALFLIGLAPVFNPIVKLLVISCYRLWIFKALKIGRFFDTSSTSVQIFSTVNAPTHSTSHLV